jgi:Holliday junction DNA helicase RuvB
MPEESVFNPAALERPPGGGAAEVQIDETQAETSLRPASLGEFIGQERIVRDLRVAVQAAQKRKHAPDHVLFSGPPGLGKTSLARVLAEEMGSHLHRTIGPTLETPKDLVGLLIHLRPGDVLFIDEIHRVPTKVEEYLYTAMEDFAVDLIIGEGADARIHPLTLPPFTLVGATTREGLLTAPFRARFGLFERLEPYPTEDLVRILSRSAGLLEMDLTVEAATHLASRSRGTPRVANRLLRRCRDEASVAGHTRVDVEVARATLENLGIDDAGLEAMDRRILRCLAERSGGPVAIKTIAAVVDETEDTLEGVFEPHLLRHGLLEKTARGRVLTSRGFDALGLEPESRLGTLFDA